MSTASTPAVPPPPHIKLNGISPSASPNLSAENSPVSSPARGRETRTALLQKLRPPPLVHAWECWIERPGSASAGSAQGSAADPGATSTSTSSASAHAADYTPHLTHLLSVTDIRQFWSLFNNLPLTTLAPGHTCALFHRGTTPRREDARNTRGGAWIFRVPRSTAAQFFTELCLLAVGEQLQNAVDDGTRVSFKDDICGVTFSPRDAAVCVVGVWNRDAEHAAGIRRVLRVVLEGVGVEVRPREGSYCYKRHDAREGFVEPMRVGAGGGGGGAAAGVVEEVESASTMTKIELDVQKVRRILEGLNLPKGGDGGGGV